MLQELTITPATVAIILVIAAWAVWAIRRLFFRGVCDCHDHCGDGECASKKKGCPSCEAADKMVADMKAAAKK